LNGSQPLVNKEEARPTATESVHRTFNHHQKLITKYDKFKDYTLVLLDYDSSRIKLNSLFLQCFFGYEGKTISKPIEKVGLRIMSASDEEKFGNQPPELIVLADGERLRLGNMYRENIEFSQSGGIYEYLVNTIDANDFVRIAKSARVEVQIGSDELQLSGDYLEALRDLASRMNP